MSTPSPTTTSDSHAPRRRLAILISSSGTNLQTLIDAPNTPVLPNSSMVPVLSNRKVAGGLARATTASPPIPMAYLACQSRRGDYDLELARIVLWAKPDLVVLAGWMDIVSESFLEVLRESSLRRSYSQINIHLALPGQFDGADAIQRGYEAFQRGEVDRLGVMVHRVVAEVDMGEPLIVREVPVEKGESIQVYEERLHRVEQEIILQATRKVPDKVRPLLPESMDLA
ncbi:formyl transferase [Pisolithus sp. B1]|nr:formyl transferase [Pisolithus sp. B1]